MSNFSKLVILFLFGLLTMGCQNNAFKPIDFSEKQDFLHQKMVFEDTDNTSAPLNRDQDISTTRNPTDRDPNSENQTTNRAGTDQENNEIRVSNPRVGQDNEMEILGPITTRIKAPGSEGTLIRPPTIVNQPPPVTTVTTPSTTPITNTKKNNVTVVQPAPVAVTPSPAPVTTTPLPAPSGSDHETDLASNKIKVTYFCSNKYTNQNKGNLLLSKKLRLLVDDCVDESDSIRENLINIKRLISPNCQSKLNSILAKGKINPGQVKLLNEQNHDLLFDTDDLGDGEFEFEFLYNTNSESGVSLNNNIVDLIKDSDVTKAGQCDRRASPLFVLMDETLKSNVLFSSITDGIMFDILGRRSNYTKQQISWTNKQGMFFISLPDRTGKVKGIDQLFGDNTYGPDRRFADNGYEALRKWDENSDGLITQDDPIYSKLRLWNDRDYNGSSDSSELLTLDQIGVEVIDLNYDKNYSEQDRFGNKIMYKSVIRTFDQRLHLLFDVWFRYLPLK